ncbi:MAG: cysteine--tRNA ligase [Omnitrophica WOR_2 bacterium RIFCSPHIGHO2_02_FULL_67_20]|nr:MAG: cysteine--tRNA ligase [Omnitrophica WOR_2 bacterium RIFCSPHIGHO2_02_FULL_67_20]
MSLRLYNTLTRSLEPFEPLAPPKVGLYVCGPTVYDDPHIGHARSAYIFDVLRRYLKHRGYDVTFVRNVTDVDDKIIEKARQELGTQDAGHRTQDLKAKCEEVAERYLKSYHDVLGRLGIAAPDREPKATGHVLPDSKNVEATKKIDASMTGCISQLITKNMAYPAGGDVYFSVRRFAEYGKLSNRSPDDLKAGARIEPGEHKEDPLDFALWKAAKPDEPSWNSPWGPGRPGWHIECSVMSTAYLGDAFDIHGGGVDLVFPHHENEIAQARALGKPFAKYWIHNGLLTVNGEKMSKSLGNFITVDAVLKEWNEPDVLKMFFLGTHYRNPIDYSVENLRASFERLKNQVHFLRIASLLEVGIEPPSKLPQEILRLEHEFTEAMDTDLNTPGALAVLDKLVKAGQRLIQDAATAYEKGDEVQRNHRTGGIVSVSHTLRRLGEVLGLFGSVGAFKLSEEDRRLIDQREAARKRKEFQLSDQIRQKLSAKGYVVEDTPDGPIVYPKS